MSRKSSPPLPEYTAHAPTTPPENPDLIGRLTFEHSQIGHLWSELQLAHRRHLDQRNLARQIVRALAEHEAVELEMLYPLVSRVVGDEWTGHAKEDHADVRVLLDEVDGEDPEDEGVFEILTEVMGKMMSHIEEEEKIIFPMLRAVGLDEELTSAAGPAPHPEARAEPEEVIDVAQAERDLAAEAAAEENARRHRSRFRIKRR